MPMTIDRAAIFAEALAAIGVVPWRTTRYANDTGTCFWCDTGTLVMVPDSMELDWYCQAKGAEELTPRLTPEVEARLEAASRAGPAATAEAGREMSSTDAALLGLANQIRREGFDEALGHARLMFEGIMESKFGPLPPMIRQRIAQADFNQLQRWSKRLFTMPRALLVVA